jgi:GntR family transcriptional repressor for pyruvate dehydrogenase complex
MTSTDRGLTFEPLTKERLSRGIVDQITEAILTGRMRPGDRLPTENELADQFGVSRTVVREATQALQAQGLVEVAPGRGTYVTHPTFESVMGSFQLMLKLEDHSFDDLLAARYLYEVPIARLAAEHALPENIGVLKACNEGMASALDDPTTYMEHDMQFHAELARATQNAVLSVLIQPLILMLQSSRPIVVKVPGKAELSLEAHWRIYEAVARGDGEAAAQCMRDHLDQIAWAREQARQMLASMNGHHDGNAQENP